MEVFKLYAGTLDLVFDDVKHLYLFNNKPVDGVTTVLKIINKPALVYWSANKAAEYIDINLPVGVPICEVEKKKLVNGCKTAHRTLLSDAGDLGTLLHDLIEKYIKKQPYQEPVNDILKTSFGQFKQFVQDNKIKFKFSERKIYSKKYNYAGTLDFTCKIGGQNYLGDIKTSSGIWDEYHLQCAAYRQALEEEFPKIKIDGTIIIRCGKDGVFETKKTNDFPENIQAFLGALVLHRRFKEMQNRKRKEKYENQD